MQNTKAKTCYIVPLAMTVALGFVMLGYCNSYYNSMTKIIHAQYIYHGKHVISSEVLFNSLVSGLIPFGAIFGSYSVGPLVKRGRRLSLICISIIFMAGASLTLIFNMYTLIFGRLIMGACVGAYVAVCPLYISETAPPSLSGSLGAFSQVGVVIGVLLGFSMAFIMPLPEQPEALTTGLWRIVFGFPIILAFTQLVLFSFVFKHDTPKFYQQKGDTEALKKVNARLFVLNTEENTVKVTPENIIQTPVEETPSVPKEANLPEKVDLEEGQNAQTPSQEIVKTDEVASNTTEGTKKGWPTYYKKALFVC